jgi:hypothetical protein
MTRIIQSALAAGAVALAFSSTASAQNWQASPSYGETYLSSGFTPDPHSVRLSAGGSIRAQDRFSDCRGYIADAPDYRLQYSAGSLPLYLNVDSDTDTTLVVNGPDGRWYCDDDGADEALNPLLYWSNPPSGQYDIWVGTYSSGGLADATLFISELGEQTEQGSYNGGYNNGGGYNSGGYGVDISAPAEFGNVTLSGGYLPDPWTRNVTAGGNLRADDAVNSSCRGYISSNPSVELNYNGSGSLYIYTSGDADTVLAINRPDGSWVCNDDGANGVNAGLQFSGNSGGVYDIYVGTYGSDRRNVTLNVSEIEMGY